MEDRDRTKEQLIDELVGLRQRIAELEATETERKRAEEALQRNERILQLFVENAPAAIAMFDRDMRYIAASRRYLIDYELGDQAVVGRSHYEVFPEIPDRWKEIHRRCLAGATEKADEDPFPRTSGKLDWVRWEIRPWYESTGEIGGIILFSEVITERKQAEEEIRHRSEDLVTLLEVSQTLAATLDLETVLQTTTDGVTELMGLKSAAVYLFEGEWLYLWATTPPLDPHMPETFRRAPLADHPHIREAVSTGLPVLLPDAATADLTPAERVISEARGLRTILYLPLLVGAQAVGTLIVATVGEPQVISEAEIDLCRTLANLAALAVENAWLYESVQRHAEELEQRVAERTAELAIAKDRAEAADRLKSAFLATMSHELRTPLNSIIGFTGIMLQGLAGPLNPEQEKQLNMVYGSARHLLALINDILDLSKIEAGEVEIVREEFDVASLVSKVVKTVSPLAERKGLELAVALSPEVGRIYCDRRRVEQILLNLVNNAIKFTKRGWVRIEGAIVENRLQVTVQDTGIGIKPEDMGKLFQVFRQVDTTITREHEGTGLGLAICKKLVTLLGGEIWAESEWGAGSTFTFTLPLSD
jgi:PAS domain S-box-containing protein